MKNFKIVHLHSDPKFIVPTINRYRCEEFNNQILFLGERKNVPSPFQQEALVFKKEKSAILKVVEACKGADLVVIYNLTDIKVDIVLALPTVTKIAWRFFGKELYSRRQDYVFSELTKKTLYASGIVGKGKEIIKKILIRNSDSSFFDAVARVDYFLGLFEEEYDFLLSQGFKLPPFMPVPLIGFSSSDINFSKEKLLIFGNNKSPNNNHLDILRKFQEVGLPGDYGVKLFFSYGPAGHYANTVKKHAQNIPQVELIEDFLTRPEFQRKYQNASAFILNGYRQMAMANVFTAINAGVKIYLSNKNATYHWLLNTKIRVFSIEEDLWEDIQNDNITLSKDQMKYNLNAFNDYFGKFTHADFHKKWIEIFELNHNL